MLHALAASVAQARERVPGPSPLTQAFAPSPNAPPALRDHYRSLPVTEGIARHLPQRLPSDPMQQIDLLLLEDLMPRNRANRISLGRTLETASILVVLICLLGLLIHATVASTTVVVAAPPPPSAEPVGSAGAGQPTP
jgi:hypothetical protein